jgi:hypothetical protein
MFTTFSTIRRLDNHLALSSTVAFFICNFVATLDTKLILRSATNAQSSGHEASAMRNLDQKPTAATKLGNARAEIQPENTPTLQD